MTEQRDTMRWTDRVRSVVHDHRWLLAVTIAVLGLGLYLRLWNIEHSFSIIHDYDEGAYSLAGKFITEGLVPYRDFMLVHPPVYVYLLAAAYKLFGYSFFVGRYLSVGASILAAGTLFVAGKRFYGTTRAGFVAAAFMALETQMVYLGRRTVQESVGLLLVSVAIALIADYLANNRRRSLVPAGVLLGIAVAVKYIMAPAVLGIAIGLAVVSLPESSWQKVRLAGRPLFLVIWGAISFVAYSFLMLLKWLGVSLLPVPFTDTMPPGAASWIVVLWVIILPLLFALMLLGPRKAQVDLGWLKTAIRSRSAWTVACWVLIGFFTITAYFWVTMPGEFLRQTVFLQGSRPTTEFPSLIAFVRAFGIGAYLGFLRMSMLPVLAVVPAILLLLNRKEFSRSDCFLAVALTGALFLCQWLYHLPRYYASLFPLLFVGISWMLPALGGGQLSPRSKAGLACIVAALLVSVNVSVILLRNYTAFDVLWAEYTTEEEDVYGETIEYLRDIDAQRIYATNPTYPALAPDLESTRQFDTFALLWLAQHPAEQIVDELRQDAVDYVLVDRWTRDWGPPYREALDDLVSEIRLNSELVHTVLPESINNVEIYRLLPEPPALANGNFHFSTVDAGLTHPLGWSPILSTDEGDEVDLSLVARDEDVRVLLTVYQDGEIEQSPVAYAGLVQSVPFDVPGITVTVLPNAATKSIGAEPLGPTVNFLDGQGHSLVLGFSDTIAVEQFFVDEAANRAVLMRPAQMNAWSEHTVDVEDYWEQTGWARPDSVDVLIVLAAHAEYPGYYTLQVDEVRVS